jgi:hypothetical protein
VDVEGGGEHMAQSTLLVGVTEVGTPNIKGN